MRALIIVGVTFMAGCGGIANDPNARAEITTLRIEIESLKAQLETERQRGVDSNGRIQALEQRSMGEWAYLDPAGGTGYATMHTSLAPLMVSFVGAQPIGDGTRIRIQVGNVTSATFSGVDLTVQYNRRVPQDSGDIEKWNSTLRNAEIALTDSIYPGTWNTVAVSLPGIKPDELGYLAVKGKLNVVSLRDR